MMQNLRRLLESVENYMGLLINVMKLLTFKPNVTKLYKTTLQRRNWYLPQTFQKCSKSKCHDKLHFLSSLGQPSDTTHIEHFSLVGDVE